MRDYAGKRAWAIAVQIKEVGPGAVERELRDKLMAAAWGHAERTIGAWRRVCSAH